MLNELENQSKQIEDLLKTKERHQKIIWVLQQEIKTHKKIEEMIIKKKNTYLNIAKKTKYNNDSNEFLSSKKIPLLNFMKNGDCLSERNSNSRSIFHTMNKKEYHDYKSLEKIYKELLDEYREIKNKYNTFNDINFSSFSLIVIKDNKLFNNFTSIKYFSSFVKLSKLPLFISLIFI